MRPNDKFPRNTGFRVTTVRTEENPLIKEAPAIPMADIQVAESRNDLFEILETLDWENVVNVNIAFVS